MNKYIYLLSMIWFVATSQIYSQGYEEDAYQYHNKPIYTLDGNLRDANHLSFMTFDNKMLNVLGGKFTLSQTGAEVQAILDRSDFTSSGQTQLDSMANRYDWGTPKGGMLFDGTDDKITVSDGDNIDFGTNDFSIEVYLKIDNITDVNQFILNKEAGGIGYGLEQRLDDLWIRFDDNSTDATAIIGTDVFVADTKYHIVVTFDRSGNATAYVNNVNVGTVDISSTSSTVSNAGDLLIGSTTAGANFFTGKINLIQIYNNALASVEVLDLYNNGRPDLAEIPYKYVGGSQTEVVLNGDFATNLANWNNVDFDTFVWDAGELNLVGAINQRGTNNASLVLGKTYNYSIDLTLNSGAGLRLQESSNTTIATYTTSGTKTGTYTSTVGGQIQLRLVGTGDWNVDNVSFVRAGAVAEYLPQNVTAATWYDASGNGLDGTTSGSPVTLVRDAEVIIVADDFTIGLDDNSKGRIVFNDASTDEVRVEDANLMIFPPSGGDGIIVRNPIDNADAIILEGWNNGGVIKVLNAGTPVFRADGSSGSAVSYFNGGDIGFKTITPDEAVDVADPVTQFDSLKIHRERSWVADDGEVTLATGVAGMGTVMIGDNTAWAYVTFTSAGAVTIEDSKGSVVNTDTDTNLCIYDAGTGIAIKNRLGSALTVAIDIQYYDPTP